MSVISLNITEINKPIVDGIPRTLSITVNIPSTIFYTLDGTDPTQFSEIYFVPIDLPTNLPSVTFKVFATNGVDTSDIITMFYSPTIPIARTNHGTVDKLGNSCCNEIPKYLYDTNSKSALVIDGYGDPGVNYAFGPDGYQVQQTTIDIPMANLPYSNYNFRGETLPAVGYRPTKTTFIHPETPPTYTNKEDKLFNPKALVVFQDVDKDKDPLSPTLLNRISFSSENTEKVRDGNLLYNAALDSPTHTGSYVRREYNPKTKRFTFYYFDSATLRWIISSFDYEPTTPEFSMGNIVYGKNKHVYKWLPVRRTLF